MTAKTNPADEPAPRYPNLASALAAFQQSLPTVHKGATGQVGQNRNYKYADLSDLNSAVLPALGAVGLSFSAKPTLNEGGRFVLAYTLRHEAGESDSGEYPLPEDATPQQMGSSQTYAKRYILQALTGVAPDDDDDGAQAPSYSHRQQRPQRPAQGPQNGQQRDTRLPAEQSAPAPSGADTARDALRALVDEKGWDGRKVAEQFASRYDGAKLKEETNAARISAFTKLLPDLADQLLATNGAAQ